MRCWLATFVFGMVVSHVGIAAPPSKLSTPIPDPGKATASDDDSSSIVVNPANIALMPGAEVRWNWVWTDSGSPLLGRGHSIAMAVPFWMLGTGLRLDMVDPTPSTPMPYDDPYHWIRWGLSTRFGDAAAFGTTLGWSVSESAWLNGAFSLTSGFTARPSPLWSIAIVARDWNEPMSEAGIIAQRSYDVGLALRPLQGRRAFELGLERTYFERSDEWVERATVGIDVPRLGRLRGDVSLFDAFGSEPTYAATAGLDLNIGRDQISGGGVFGSALTKSGTGFYGGIAIRTFREPGVLLPARVARIRIDSTPGVRGHTRLLRRLWRIANDPELDGLVLVLRDEPASSLAHAEEIGAAIDRIRDAGKKVMCHLEDAGGRSLYVCARGDRIVMNPAGGLRFAGISSSYFYVGNLLKKLGVEADFVRIGAHKLAAEQFSLPEGSDVSKVDHQDLVNQTNHVFVTDVARARHRTIEDVSQQIAKGPFVAEEARQARFVDQLAYDDEIERAVHEMMGKQVHVVDYEPRDDAPPIWGNVPKVAIVYLAGDMVDGESKFIPFIGVLLAGSKKIAESLRRIREDDSVKAVVFRIETGCGSSLAADVILREAVLTAKKKPLIVSMGAHAASGGYYVAVAGQKIFANRSTVTGSIGIFYGKVDVGNLLRKIGIERETFRSAPRADAESLFRPFTDDERTELGKKVKQFYDVFVARVAEGRHMKPEAVDAVARGRVWTGEQASQNGLVDEIGGLADALSAAREAGGLPSDAPVMELPEPDGSILGFLLDMAGVTKMKESAIDSMFPQTMMGIARMFVPFLVFDSNKPLARMEYIEEDSLGFKKISMDDP